MASEPKTTDALELAMTPAEGVRWVLRGLWLLLVLVLALVRALDGEIGYAAWLAFAVVAAIRFWTAEDDVKRLMALNERLLRLVPKPPTLADPPVEACPACGSAVESGDER